MYAIDLLHYMTDNVQPLSLRHITMCTAGYRPVLLLANVLHNG